MHLLSWLPETVVVELAVWRHGDETAWTDAERVEDLRRGVRPDARVRQTREVWRQVEQDAVNGAGQGGSPDQQDGQHHVREQRREIYNLQDNNTKREKSWSLKIHGTFMSEIIGVNHVNAL